MSLTRIVRTLAWSAVSILFVAIAVSRADDLSTEAGFTRLDNGKDLAGWSGDLTGWSVRDGAIHLDAKNAKGNIYCATPHSRNCIIRLQFQATPRADSGVCVHGKQFQVRDYPTAGPKPYAGPCKPAGQWNDLEWDITDGVAVVKLNGTVIEPAWPIGTKAASGLGLQKESGDFDFRNIRVKDKS
jgi:hypothetical protein